jgi:polygalacturonase
MPTVEPLCVSGKVLDFFRLLDSARVTLTGDGTIDGQGQAWWDAAITGEVALRPHMLTFVNSTDLILERLTLRNSPRFHVFFRDCARVIVRFVTIDVDRFTQRALKARMHADRLARLGVRWWLVAAPLARHLYRLDRRPFDPYPSWEDWLLDKLVKLLPAWALQPEDLNTDGIDPNGIDFHIHDCSINNDDDSIAVKPLDSAKSSRTKCTQDMLIENMTLTGFGASIGSVTPHADVNCVRNITFRNISMPGTGKGIYIKVRGG